MKENYTIIDGNVFRKVESPDYHSIFDFRSGYFCRWGKTLSDDNTPPVPEVLDLEVTTSCTGVNGVLCPYCYKGNTPVGRNMSFDEFKDIFDSLPRTLTQIAFSADSTLKANPDVFKMLEYCRNNDHNYVVPSISVAQLDAETARKLYDAHAGCVGVSRYADKDVAYDTVKLLTDLSGSDEWFWQINMHLVISDDTFEETMETLHDIVTDPRLAKLHSVVFLSLKQKGRGENSHLISPENFKTIIEFSKKHLPMFGLDVCATPKLLNVWDCDQTRVCSDPCDSGIYGFYINLDGEAFPCSFMENTPNWEQGVPVLGTTDFMGEVWNHSKFTNHRRALKAMQCSTNRLCPVWDI